MNEEETLKLIKQTVEEMVAAAYNPDRVREMINVISEVVEEKITPDPPGVHFMQTLEGIKLDTIIQRIPAESLTEPVNLGDISQFYVNTTLPNGDLVVSYRKETESKEETE